MKPDKWDEELPQKQVVQFDEALNVRIRIGTQFESLAKVLAMADFQKLKLKSHGTAPDGKDITLSVQNTSFQIVDGKTELRVELQRNDLKTAGVIPSAEQDSVKEIAWYDLVKDARSNLDDSRAWEAANSDVPEKDKRGRCYKEGDLKKNADRPIDKTFVVAGGAEVITAEFAGQSSEKQQLAQQADVFYISGHGSYGDGTFSVSEDGKTRFGAADPKWDKDMEVVIVGGCSIFGIQTKKYRYPSMTSRDQNYYDSHYGGAADASPGEKWENLKPDVKLGYCFTAPLDTQGMPGIISSYQALVKGGMDPVEAWGTANKGTTGVNACAIDTRKTPHEYWYFKKVSTGWFSSDLQWTKVVKPTAGW